MRKIVVAEFVTFDNVIQAPGGAEEDTEGGFTQGGWTWPYWQRVDRIMLYAVGESKLAKGLVNRQAISYTLLEKRESCEDRPAPKDWCRRMPYAHCE